MPFRSMTPPVSCDDVDEENLDRVVDLSELKPEIEESDGPVWVSDFRFGSENFVGFGRVLTEQPGGVNFEVSLMPLTTPFLKIHPLPSYPASAYLQY